LPGDLIETLSRSFADRLAGLPLATTNLMFAFRGGEPPPSTLWEALSNLGPTAVNLLVRLFDRMAGVDPSLGVWRQIKYLRNQWWGGTGGVKVVYDDPPAMRACLDGLLHASERPRVARDKLIGAVEHQATAAARLLPRAILRVWSTDQTPPDCDTWREVDRLGQEALHFCVDRSDLKAAGTERTASHDDIHLDWKSPVDGVRSGLNQCTYDLLTSLVHWRQATRGRGAPRFNFDAVARGIDALRARGGTASAKAALADLEARWHAVAWSLAVRGKVGHDEASAYADEVARLQQL
jgi:hypothetical protein